MGAPFRGAASKERCCESQRRIYGWIGRVLCLPPALTRLYKIFLYIFAIPTVENRLLLLLLLEVGEWSEYKRGVKNQWNHCVLFFRVKYEGQSCSPVSNSGHIDGTRPYQPDQVLRVCA